MAGLARHLNPAINTSQHDGIREIATVPMTDTKPPGRVMLTCGASMV